MMQLCRNFFARRGPRRLLLFLLVCPAVRASAAIEIFADPLAGGTRGVAHGGRFVPGGGWQPVEKFDRLIIELPVAARDGSAVEVDIRNFDVPNQRDDGENFILGLREHLELSGGGANVPHADYFLIYAGTKYPQFKLKYHTHGFSHQEGNYAPLKSFDPQRTYRLRVEWGMRRLAVSFDGEVFYEQTTPESDPFDRVKFIQLGYLRAPSERQAFGALRGPIYSNVRVTTTRPAGPARAPRDLIAPEQGTSITLRWQAPAEKAGLKEYRVFRDAVQIGRVAAEHTEYQETPSAEGRYTYTVAAVYEEDHAPVFAVEPAHVIVLERSLAAGWTAAPILLDGRLEESAWRLPRTAAKRLQGRPDNRVTFGALWDETHLYLAARVLDAARVRDSANPTDDDAVEFVIDGNNNGRPGAWGAHQFDEHDRQIILRWQDSGVFIKEGRAPLRYFEDARRAPIRAAMAPISGGYTVEVAVPWTELRVAPEPGLSVGLDVRVHDDDHGGAREALQGWMSESLSSTFTLAYGDVVLTRP